MKFPFLLPAFGFSLLFVGAALAQQAEVDDFGPIDDDASLPDSAHRAEVDEFGPVRDDAKFHTPQDFALELRIGPYLPKVENFAATNPPTGQEDPTSFSRFFGNKTRWHVGLELDWQALRVPYFGSIGAGLGMGFTSFEGATFTQDSEKAGRATSLSILPMHAVGVVRVDTLAVDAGVPLVPYAKLGVGYALWWTDNGRGSLSRNRDTRAPLRGASNGLVWALGGMLLLDAFDEVAAADLDSTSGINHSYVYLEWFNSDLDPSDDPKRLQVGVNTWMTGLALEL